MSGCASFKKQIAHLISLHLNEEYWFLLGYLPIFKKTRLSFAMPIEQKFLDSFSKTLSSG